IAGLRRGVAVPVFAVSPDQEEVGRIQGKQLAAIAPAGNILYIEGTSASSASTLRTKGILSTKPGRVEMKVLKGDWSQRAAHQAGKSCLALSTSSQVEIKAVVCQNGAMAIVARE